MPDQRSGPPAPAPLAKKLGVHEGDLVWLVGAEPCWTIPDLPRGAWLRREATRAPLSAAQDRETPRLIVAFFRSRAELVPVLERLAPVVFPAGVVWAAWPRRAAGHESDITDNAVREVALSLGLVDIKVASLGDDWSGLRLVWQKALRHARPPQRGR